MYILPRDIDNYASYISDRVISILKVTTRWRIRYNYSDVRMDTLVLLYSYVLHFKMVVLKKFSGVRLNYLSFPRVCFLGIAE